MIGVFYAYISLNSLYWGLFNFSKRKYMPEYVQIAKGMHVNAEQIRLGPSTLCNGVDAECMRTYAAVIASGIFLLSLTHDVMNIIIDLIPALLFINVILQKNYKSFRLKTDWGTTPPIQGFGANPSLDSTLCSLMFAVMLMNEYHWIYWVIAIPSLLYCLYRNKATSGLLGVLGASSAWLMLHQYYIPLLLLWLACGTIVYFNRELLSPSGRLEIYKHAYEKLWIRSTKRFGLGNGAFKLVMMLTGNIKVKGYENSKGDITSTSHLHSDILQMPLDIGIVGVVLFVIMFLSLIFTMNTIGWIFLAALLPNVLFNFPIHLAPHVFFILLALKQVYL